MIHLPNAQATDALGQRLARALLRSERGLVMTLEGELGVGKTTVARSTIAALGYGGAVVSPTYTLLESYAVADRHLHHLDLYRLADPEELEFIGLRELDATRDWFMVEWPDRGAGYLLPVDLRILLRHADTARAVDLQPVSAAGNEITDCFR